MRTVSKAPEDAAVLAIFSGGTRGLQEAMNGLAAVAQAGVPLKLLLSGAARRTVGEQGLARAVPGCTILPEQAGSDEALDGVAVVAIPVLSLNTLAKAALLVGDNPVAHTILHALEAGIPMVVATDEIAPAVSAGPGYLGYAAYGMQAQGGGSATPHGVRVRVEDYLSRLRSYGVRLVKADSLGSSILAALNASGRGRGRTYRAPAPQARQSRAEPASASTPAPARGPGLPSPAPASAPASASACAGAAGGECSACGRCVETNPGAVSAVVAAGASRISASPGVRVSSAELASMIDHTLLKPDATVEQIRQLCEEARKYGFASVCVNPSHVKLCADLLRGTRVKVCTVIGFPLGATTPATKAAEAREALQAGADELDMVINVGALKSGDYDLVRRDIEGVVEAAAGKAVVKVILETALLTDDEKVKACTLAKYAGADFVKTSTGFGPGGAKPEDISLMRGVVGPGMGVKASGGIRDYDTALAMVRAGATRIGASASVAIIKQAAEGRSSAAAPTAAPAAVGAAAGSDQRY